MVHQRVRPTLATNQLGVLQKLITCTVESLLIVGTICTAEAPVPTIPTRFPCRETSWRHCAACQHWPLKFRSPAVAISAGMFGTCKPPTAEMTTAALKCCMTGSDGVSDGRDIGGAMCSTVISYSSVLEFQVQSRTLELN